MGGKSIEGRTKKARRELDGDNANSLLPNHDSDLNTYGFAHFSPRLLAIILCIGCMRTVGLGSRPHSWIFPIQFCSALHYDLFCALWIDGYDQRFIPLERTPLGERWLALLGTVTMVSR
jgi:hypothetical protein